jgi:(p)ppGpp synthase/HD superfamily hydrolase
MTTNTFIEFCINQHDTECNQKYNKTLPYSFHLKMVASQVDKFKYLINKKDYEIAYKSAFGHDLIEDARMTWNDIYDISGKEVADVIFACTDLRGKNRKERHGVEYFNVLKENRIAVFVKISDVIANVKFGLLTNSHMYEKYKSEFLNLKSEIYLKEFDDMFSYLERLLNV